jgi:hypothetical protein
MRIGAEKSVVSYAYCSEVLNTERPTRSMQTLMAQVIHHLSFLIQ